MLGVVGVVVAACGALGAELTTVELEGACGAAADGDRDGLVAEPPPGGELGVDSGAGVATTTAFEEGLSTLPAAGW